MSAQTPYKNKIQTKFLPTNVTTSITVANLTFNNLVVGKWYDLSGQLLVGLDQAGVNDDALTITINNGATMVLQVTPTIGAPDTQSDGIYMSLAVKFLATATTLTFVTVDASANSLLGGNGTRSATFVQLEERNDLVTTTDFT